MQKWTEEDLDLLRKNVNKPLEELKELLGNRFSDEETRRLWRLARIQLIVVNSKLKKTCEVSPEIFRLMWTHRDGSAREFIESFIDLPSINATESTLKTYFSYARRESNGTLTNIPQCLWVTLFECALEEGLDLALRKKELNFEKSASKVSKKSKNKSIDSKINTTPLESKCSAENCTCHKSSREVLIKYGLMLNGSLALTVNTEEELKGAIAAYRAMHLPVQTVKVSIQYT